MVISYKNKFIFIHNYKVAGSSIREALKKYKGRPYESILYRLLAKLRLLPGPGSFSAHTSILDVKTKMPAVLFDRLFKFGFVRNPWDWQVSLYHFARQTKHHHQYSLFNRMNFEEYIQWRVTHDRHLQKDFFTDENDNVLMDFIGKYENLQEDFNRICDILGIQEKLSHMNPSNRGDYRKYYNAKTKDLIHKYFKEDIEMFGYTF